MTRLNESVLTQGRVLLRLADVMAKTGMARSTLYRLVQHGKFPKPVKLTEHSSAWEFHEVEEWIDQRVKARDGEVSA